MTNKPAVISIFDILKIIKKNSWFILLILVISLSGMFAVANFVITPQYKATNQILVVQNTDKEDSNVQNSEVQANLQMVNTYSAMIKSPLVLDKVAENLDGQYTSGELSKKIVTSNDQNSQVLNIHVEDPNQATAAKIANETASVFKETLPVIMRDKAVTDMSQAKIVDNARPVTPNNKMLYVLSLVAGIVFAGLFCFLRELLDTSIKTEEQITEKLDLTVLGTISKIPDNSMKSKPKSEAVNKDVYTEAKPVYEK
ncbi:Wzz/FepE/Etk N-terminal domain-containing protein [Listeria rocourtiae]|uniref:YveK family protein n=1 Tax=Listeria rocourtiae TaxID=647910 RepID=UPI003D2F8889